MGVIPSSDRMPSFGFTNPKNGDTLKGGTPFTIIMAINDLQTGAFVKANHNYFAAPRQLSAQGTITVRSHAVVEQLTALSHTTPLDPIESGFSLNAAAKGGILSVGVAGGLPPGVVIH